MKRIGERIKNKRELLGFQLNELAKNVGISPSALSQIEKAKSFPTIATLKMIADCLNSSVGELIGENETLTHNPVCRKDEYQFVERNVSKTEVFETSIHDISKHMETFKLTFSRESDSVSLFRRCNGQIFAYLLSGEVQFEIDSKSYVVQPGDTLYFNAKRNFKFQNTFAGKSELLCVSLNTNL